MEEKTVRTIVRSFIILPLLPALFFFYYFGYGIITFFGPNHCDVVCSRGVAILILAVTVPTLVGLLGWIWHLWTLHPRARAMSLVAFVGMIVLSLFSIWTAFQSYRDQLAYYFSPQEAHLNPSIWISTIIIIICIVGIYFFGFNKDIKALFQAQSSNTNKKQA